MTGNECEHCRSGWLVCYCTKRSEDRTVRYFACWLCGHKPRENKTCTSNTTQPNRQRRRTRTESVPD